MHLASAFVFFFFPNVLQTLNYVRTPHRFELVLSKPLTIGLRRAAQRLVGAATPALTAARPKCTTAEEEANAAMAALTAALKQM